MGADIGHEATPGKGPAPSRGAADLHLAPITSRLSGMTAAFLSDAFVVTSIAPDGPREGR
jgi:hypothetical protein